MKNSTVFFKMLQYIPMQCYGISLKSYEKLCGGGDVQIVSLA